MAPTDQQKFEWQTNEIIKCLLEDEDDRECRRFDASVETDGPG